MKKTNSTERSIKEIHDILNHRSNVSVNGQPPYSPLPEETVGSLKEQLERLKKCLAEREDVRKKELKLAGLKEFIIPHEIKISRDEPIRLEPILLEPIRFEHIRLEPKVLKPRPQKKSDGWRTPNRK